MERKIWTRNFTLSIILAVVALSTQIVNYFLNDYYLDKVAYWSLILADLMAFTYVYRYGTFFKSKFKNILYLFVSLNLMAALFKIQHWPGANLLTTLCWVGIAVAYALWFLIKPQRKLIDILKLIWVIVFCTVTLLSYLHWFNFGYAGVALTTGFLFIIYIMVHLDRTKPALPQEPEWDFDRLAQDDVET